MDTQTTKEGDTVTSTDGVPITWPAGSRYVWRLVPYLDDAMGHQ